MGGTVAYRLNTAQPRLTLDYGLAWSDFSKPSSSYFTPLESVRHAAGLGLAGFSERSSIDYSARYEFSLTALSRSPSASVSGSLLDGIPLGLEGYYSVDNHSYRTWGLTLSGSVRW